MRILVVDDEHDIKPLFQQMFRKELRAGALELVFAHSAQEALSLLERTPPHYALILSDVNMPGMSGFELLKQTRVSHPDVQVIMLSAYSDEDSQQKAFSLGAVDFLAKPVNFSLLKSRIVRPGTAVG
jgi:CheY-like chemotaxis protein